VKRTLALRAGNRCSEPNCRALTSGPQVDDAKALNVGVAAHITGAAPRGPRFDPNLSPRERGDASNGIWLCQTHAKLVDNDLGYYTREMLTDWKQRAEDEAREEIGRAQRGAELVQANGISLPGGQAAVRGVIVEMLKGVRLAWIGSATVLSIANRIPFDSACYFEDASWTRNSEVLGQILDIEVLDTTAIAYDSARRVFDFAGRAYPETTVNFQLPSMLTGVACELLEAASLVVERIADPGERQRFKEKIAKSVRTLSSREGLPN
jgi:hypothetical protein